MKALPLAAVPAPPEVDPTTAPLVPGGHEASMLEAVMRFSTLLPAGWQAEILPGSVTLSWRAG